MEEPSRFYNFKKIEVVHIGRGEARIVSITGPCLQFVDDLGQPSQIDLEECARMQVCLEQAQAFPPGEDFDWAALADATAGFASLPLSGQRVVGLRAAVDEPPWFQFLDRRRTQFEFIDYDHIKSALLDPLWAAGQWSSWDAS